MLLALMTVCGSERVREKRVREGFEKNRCKALVYIVLDLLATALRALYGEARGEAWVSLLKPWDMTLRRCLMG